MNKIISVVNSQKAAIVILLLLNLFQLRELGLLRIKLKEITYKLSLIELKIDSKNATTE